MQHQPAVALISRRSIGMRHPASRTIGYQLIHAARLHRARTARLLEGLGLFPGQEQVFEALAARDGMTMSELAEILRVRPPTASKTIARLSGLGLVERRAADGDGRVVRVALTEAGRDKARAIETLALDIEAEVTADLDGKDRKRLRKLLKRVEKSLRGALGAAPGGEPEEHRDDAEVDEA
jgi:DNA-binding MarR family transcriptional regulator